MSQNIALVGLGRIGMEFLVHLLKHKSQGFNIICVAEIGDTPGRIKAEAAGITVLSVKDIITMGAEIDIIFDLTGNSKIRKVMRQQLAAANNYHTVIAPETITMLVWSLLTEHELPESSGYKGY